MSNFSFVQLPGNGVTQNFGFSFPYMNKTHVSVKVDGVATEFTWLTSSIIKISPAPTNGSIVEIRRNTPITEAVVDYQNGAVIGEADLDNSNLQTLYIAQELEDARTNAILLGSDGNYEAFTRKIRDVADPNLPQDAATKAYVDSQFAESGAAHAFTSHTDVDSGAAIAAGSVVLGNESSPSKLSTIAVGGKGSLFVGVPSEGKKVKWVPIGGNYGHLVADSGKTEGLKWVPSHTFTSNELEMVGDANTNNLALLDAGFTALPSGGGRIVIGPGTYDFSGAVTVGAKPVIIEGCGKGVTILQVTSLVNLAHFFALTKSAIFRNLTLKVKTPSDTDYAMTPIRLDLFSGGSSNQFLICENVEFLDFDLGLYADGGGINTDASLIDFVLYRNCNGRIRTTADIPRGPFTAHRCKEVVLENCLGDNNSDGDHGAYLIRNARVNVINSTFINTPYHGIKLITNPGDIGTLLQWEIESCRFHTNDTAVAVSTTNSLSLPQLTLNDISARLSSPRDSSTAAVWISAADTSVMERVNLNNLRVNGSTKGAVQFDVATGARIRHVSCDAPTIIGWSTGSSGTYAAFSKAGAGPLDVFQCDKAYFDGAATGKKPFNLVENGVFMQTGSVYATGCTEPHNSVIPHSSPVGEAAVVANVVGVVARHTAQNGTIANTTETDLFSYTVKAKSLAKDGATFRMKAHGFFGANANAKTVRVRWDGNILIFNDISTNPNGLRWELEVTVTRIGTDQQRCFGVMSCGTTRQTNTATFTTAVQSADKVFKLTGQNGTSAVDDVVLSFVEVTFSE